MSGEGLQLHSRKVERDVDLQMGAAQKIPPGGGVARFSFIETEGRVLG